MPLFRLKGKNYIRDRRCDAIPEFDERSLAFNIADLFDTAELPSPKRWKLPLHLDQGREGACVGFGLAHCLAAMGVEEVDKDFAMQIYHRAQTLDQWPGEAYDGTSLLGGLKAVQALMAERGEPIKEYRWAFNVQDLARAVSEHGPAAIAVPWFEQMGKPTSYGIVTPNGTQTGRHCVMVKGWEKKWRTFIVHNSWGNIWGCGGDCLIPYDDMELLLKNSGEAAFLVL